MWHVGWTREKHMHSVILKWRLWLRGLLCMEWLSCAVFVLVCGWVISHLSCSACALGNRHWWSNAALYGPSVVHVNVCTCWCSSGPDKWAVVAPASPGPADLCLREGERERVRQTPINHCCVSRENVAWVLVVRTWLIHLFFLPSSCQTGWQIAECFSHNILCVAQ